MEMFGAKMCCLSIGAIITLMFKPMNETPFHVLLIICSMMGFLSILELVCGLFLVLERQLFGNG
jgi:hypothetical protein